MTAGDVAASRVPPCPPGPGAKLLRTLCVQVCHGVPAPKDASRALPSIGPPAGGVGSYPRGALGLRLLGLLHLPYLSPALPVRPAGGSRERSTRKNMYE